MSTIYTDGAGNKYLGDCRWGNHDINYPTTNYLISVTSSTLQEVFNDFNAIFTASGYNNIYTPPTVPAYGASTDIFRFTFPSITNSTLGFRRTQYGLNYNWFDTVTANNNTLTAIASGGFGASVSHFQYEIGFPASVPGLNYVVMCGPGSYASFMHSPAPSINKSYSDSEFIYYGLLENVNPQFSYYTNTINHTVLFHSFFVPVYDNLFTYTTTQLYFPSDFLKYNHYIAGATKPLLQTGRAIYSVLCSDGQTPASQWATDMWVYDNNATLGYPVIGRVPNMLLGTGTYTYLKPVKILSNTFPDFGSPWYLPVGIFAGKTLLMRCYSSIT